MHIPDGFLNPGVWAGSYVASAGALGYSIRKSREVLKDRQVPALGVMAAFIFAAQMINFPVAAATSGHLLGAALATVILGPWSASLIMTTVLVIQAFFFGDGGITALGANMLNMAVLAPFAAGAVYKMFNRLRGSETVKITGIFLAAWFSVFIAALATALELALSGSVPLKIVLPIMAGWHALIGVGEGLITVVAARFIQKLWAPEMMGGGVRE